MGMFPRSWFPLTNTKGMQGSVPPRAPFRSLSWPALNGVPGGGDRGAVMRKEGRDGERKEGRDGERKEGRDGERKEGRDGERKEGRDGERKEG